MRHVQARQGLELGFLRGDEIAHGLLEGRLAGQIPFGKLPNAGLKCAVLRQDRGARNRKAVSASKAPPRGRNEFRKLSLPTTHALDSVTRLP